jgi:hypothetical protein
VTPRGAVGPGDGGDWRWVALALPFAVVALFLVAALALFGVRGARPADTEDAAPAHREPVAVDGPAAAVDAVVELDAASQGLRPPPVLAGVTAGDVVDVRGWGFPGDTDGVIAQCDAVAGRRCRNLFPVRTDEHGALRTQYRLSTTTPGGALVVAVDVGRAGAVVGARARPVVRLAGDTLVVTGAEAGTDLAVLRCGRHAETTEDCRPGSTLAVASDGTARGGVGDTRRGERIVVADAAGTVLAEPLVPAASKPPAAVDEVDLDGRRVAVGLLVALLLVGVAARLIRSTDWRAPAEAEVATSLDPS